MLKELETYTWEQAFIYVDVPDLAVPGDSGSWEGIAEPGKTFTREDVAEFLGYHSYSPEGYGSEDVVGVFKLSDGRYAVLRASCDTTGWDCQAGGSSEVAATLFDLVWFALDQSEALRLYNNVNPTSEYDECTEHYLSDVLEAALRDRVAMSTLAKLGDQKGS